MYLNVDLFICADGCCRTLNTVEPLFTVMARSRLVSTSVAIFSSLIDGCLKYKNKKNPKIYVNIGPKPSPRDVKKSEPDFKLNVKKNTFWTKSVCSASVTEHVPRKYY